jgi:hypothetical protein
MTCSVYYLINPLSDFDIILKEHTTRRKVLLEKLTVAQLVRQFPARPLQLFLFDHPSNVWWTD